MEQVNWKSFLKPTIGKVILFFLLPVFKEIVFSLLMLLPGKIGAYALTFAITVLSPFDINLSPLIVDVLSNETRLRFSILLSVAGWIYTYLIVAFIIFLLQKKFKHPEHPLFRKLKISFLIFIITIITLFLSASFPPRIPGESYEQSINFARLSVSSYHRPVIKQQPDQALIQQFPSIPFVELWVETETEGFSPIEWLAEQVFGTSIVSPAYTYAIVDNTVLGPAIACIDVDKTRLVLADGWSNELLGSDNIPLTIQSLRGTDRAQIEITNFHSDNSVEVIWGEQSFTLSPGKEHIEEVKRIGLFFVRTLRWGISNFGLTKNQCFPDFIFDSERKDRSLRDLARREQDDSFCKEVQSSETKERCFQAVYSILISTARDEANEEFCFKIDQSVIQKDMRSECLKEVAKVTHRGDLCLLISTKYAQSECFRVALERPENCDDITDAQTKDNCFFGLHYCEYVSDYTNQSMCYLNYMEEIWKRIGYEKSQEVCENIGPTGGNKAWFNRGVCFQKLASGVAQEDPIKAISLVEKVPDDPERQGIMYDLIAEIVVESDLELALELCDRITIETLYASRDHCIATVKSKTGR